MKSIQGAEIKKALIDISKKQVWLVRELQNNGFPQIDNSYLSQILNGGLNGMTAELVFAKCYQIIEEERNK